MGHKRRHKTDIEKRKVFDFLNDSRLFFYDRSPSHDILKPRTNPDLRSIDLLFNNVVDRPGQRKKKDGRPVTYTVSRPSFRKTDSVNDRLSFVSPKKVKVCVSRKIRREVLFAKKKAGKSGGKMKPYRITLDSKIKC